MLVYNQQNSKVFQEKPMQGVPLDSNVRNSNILLEYLVFF